MVFDNGYMLKTVTVCALSALEWWEKTHDFYIGWLSLERQVEDTDSCLLLKDDRGLIECKLAGNIANPFKGNCDKIDFIYRLNVR